MRVFKIEVADIPTINRIMATCEQMDSCARAEPSGQERTQRLDIGHSPIRVKSQIAVLGRNFGASETFCTANQQEASK